MSRSIPNLEFPVKGVAAANFLAAFGGGTILNKAMGVVDLTGVGSGSILAFMLGTALGLVLMYAIPKSFMRTKISFVSFTSAMVSLALLAFLYLGLPVAKGEVISSVTAISVWAESGGKLAGAVGWLFFFVLCLRFALWFVARILRSNVSAGRGQGLAWVDLSYYAGFTIGLILWRLPGLENWVPSALQLGLGGLLVLDVSLHVVAGAIDFIFARRIVLIEKRDTQLGMARQSGGVEAEPRAPKPHYLWLLASVVALNTAIQMPLFGFLDFIGRAKELAGVAGYGMAVYYLGVAVSATLCGRLKLSIQSAESERDLGTVTSPKLAAVKFKASHIGIISTILLVAALYSFRVGYDSAHSPFDVSPIAIIVMLILVIISAFFLEIFLLVVLDRMAKESYPRNMVALAIGLMGFIGAFVLFGLIYFKTGYLGWAAVSILSTVISIGCLCRWKDLSKQVQIRSANQARSSMCSDWTS